MFWLGYGTLQFLQIKFSLLNSKNHLFRVPDGSIVFNKRELIEIQHWICKIEKTISIRVRKQHYTMGNSIKTNI